MEFKDAVAVLGPDILQVRARGPQGEWRVDATELPRVRRFAQIGCKFDAVPVPAALVADLEDDPAQLRALLNRPRRP